MATLFAKLSTWPLAYNMIRQGSLSNTFGLVRKTREGLARCHQGWDFYAAEGTPCYAVQDGTVVFAGVRGDFGKLIIIKLAGGGTMYAAYAHLSGFEVVEGDQVKLGQEIGKTGTTGNAEGMTGAQQHLHFELRTVPFPGLGLAQRISPIAIFGECPLNKPVFSVHVE